MVDYINSSRDRRPDTVSRDYFTAFTVGPVAIGDNSEGLAYRPWKGRLDGNEFKICRGLDSSWDAETVVFTLPNDLLETVEIDFCFSQNASPVVVCERKHSGQSEVWLYWFKPTAGTNVFEKICDGRTPKIVLDDPVNTANSDVQVIYIDDLFDTFRRREQRSLYATAYDVPVTDVADKYLEDIYRSRDHRLYLLWSERNEEIGRYSFARLGTTLFPIIMEDEGFEFFNEFLSAVMQFGVWIRTMEPDSFEAYNSWVSTVMRYVVAEYNVSGEIRSDLAIMTFGLRDVLIIKSLDPEMFDAFNSWVSATMIRLIIVGNIDPESFDASSSIVSAVMIVP